MLAGVLAGSVVAQAVGPRRRVAVLTFGAGVSLAAGALLGVATPRSVFAAIPWDVLVLLVTLGALSELIAEARVFDVVAVGAARLSGGRPARVLRAFSMGMFVVSGLVSNLTALLLVLPVQLTLLRLQGADLRDPQGEPLHFGFREHLAPGVLGCGVTLGVALGYAALGLWTG